MTGRAFCKEWVPPDLLDPSAAPRFDPVEGPERLWDVFSGINDAWGLVTRPHGDGTIPDASALRSSWREFIGLRLHQAPSYEGEYGTPWASWPN